MKKMVQDHRKLVENKNRSILRKINHKLRKKVEKCVKNLIKKAENSLNYLKIRRISSKIGQKFDRNG